MDQDEAELDDREFPDESDMDPQGDDQDEDTEPCPKCGKKVFVGSEWCPYCGRTISPQSGGKKSLWIAVVAVVCGIAMLLYYVRSM